MRNSEIVDSRVGRVVVLAVCLVCVSSPPANAAAPAFSRDVRPILSQHCFKCHGPDEGERQAELRLDVPGNADLNEVLARISSTDPEVMMPPPAARKELTAAKIETLKQWVAAGAKYEQHWAFVPPQKSETPPDTHPVDWFVDQRLQVEGLSRSPQTDPATLIRRVYLDLIGLPPTIQQADEFMADPSAQAYAAVVDELLESPRYGERWARRWLDLARYADTNGYEKDRDRSIWPYRDWAIRAINAGMPFDEFTVAQLAGDMLPNATADQIIATGFHRNTMLNEEGGIDPLEFRFHAMTDRVATTGTTWLGLTTGCAQCHTHKYDPITHHDYFGMMAYLNNAEEPDYFVQTAESLAAQKQRISEAAQIIAELPTHWPQKVEKPAAAQTFDEAFAKWWEAERPNIQAWRTITPHTMRTNLPYLTQEAHGVIFSAGDTSKHDLYTLQFPASETQITSIRLEALPDERLPAHGPGMTYYEGPIGDFYLTEFRIQLAGSNASVKFGGASETYAKNAFGNNRVAADLATDDDYQTGWSVNKRPGHRHVAVFNLTEPIAAGTSFTLNMDFGRHYGSSLGKFRLSVTDVPQQVKASLLQAPLAALTVEAALADLSVREAFLMHEPALADVATRLVDLRQTNPGTPTLVMRERPDDHQRPTHRHHRGEYTQPKEQVTPHVPEQLLREGQTPPGNRLDFARWLVSRENPLTARVVANRQWAAFFGTGIVSTLDDFGMQGESPSHPELLDYLAVDFMDSQWSVKALHRLIVTSNTYKQASDVPKHDDHPLARRLLQRFPRTRLEAEIIRDASLAVADLLHEKMFGPPVRPTQPAAAVAANYSKSTWTASEGVDRFRRSVYTYQKRTAPFAMFTTFDATSGEACVARRDTSNTPLQALTLMNDPMFLEIAEAFGQRMAAVEGDAGTKISAGFRRLLTRSPTASELELLVEFHTQHPDWTAVARALLCLDESITKN